MLQPEISLGANLAWVQLRSCELECEPLALCVFCHPASLFCASSERTYVNFRIASRGRSLAELFAKLAELKRDIRQFFVGGSLDVYDSRFLCNVLSASSIFQAYFATSRHYLTGKTYIGTMSPYIAQVT